MITGVPVPFRFRSCGLRAPGSDRSDGLPRRLASCGLDGLMPGARPTVVASAGDGGDTPGTVLGAPGADEVAAPLGLVGLAPEVVPVAPEVAPPVLPVPPLEPPLLWATATLPEIITSARIVPRRSMVLLPECTGPTASGGLRSAPRRVDPWASRDLTTRPALAGAAIACRQGRRRVPPRRPGRSRRRQSV
jgi:hypothetical protein